MSEPTMEEIQKEVDTNFDFFMKELNNIINFHYDKYVLIKNAEFIEYFDTIDDAEKYAKLAFKDGLYSIQHVNNNIADLGYIGLINAEIYPADNK